MHELSFRAAAEWARTNSAPFMDPVEFGHKVALAYLACEKTWASAGDEEATTAALASLSIPPETLQALALLSSLHPASPAGNCQKAAVGAEG